MNDFILRAKHWQVFLVVSLSHIVSWFVRDEAVVDGLDFAGTLVLVVWLILQVQAFASLRPLPAGYNLLWFFFNSAVVLIAQGYSSVAEDPNFSVSGTHWHAEGLPAFFFFYVVFAHLHIRWFTASLLSATETGRSPDIGKGALGFFLYLFWPIGVWFTQPRLNKLWEEKEWQQQALEKVGRE